MNQAVKTVNGVKKENFNQSVKIIQIKHQIVKFFPQGIDTFFPNLEAISIYNSPLKEIKKSELQNFRKLKRIIIDNCELQTLEGNLLESNPEIRRISFKGNKLKVIGENLLKSLKKLEAVNFKDNDCINKEATNHNEITEMQNEIRKFCPTYENVKKIIDINEKLRLSMQTELINPKWDKNLKDVEKDINVKHEKEKPRREGKLVVLM